MSRAARRRRQSGHKPGTRDDRYPTKATETKKKGRPEGIHGIRKATGPTTPISDRALLAQAERDLRAAQHRRTHITGTR